MKSINYDNKTKKIGFKKVFNYMDETFVDISLVYKNSNCSDIDLDELEKTIIILLTEYDSVDSLSNIAYTFKTIFRNYEEEELEIKIGKNNEIINSIFYKNGIVEKYYSKSCYGYTNFKFNYDLSESTFNVQIENNDNFPYFMANKIAEREINQVEQLNIYGTKKTLNYDEKLICKIYKLFYNELPDFRDNNTELKIQAMILILKNHGVNFGNKYEFTRGKIILISCNLSSLFRKLKPFGIIDLKDDEIKISEINSKSIVSVGEEINNFIINNNLNQIDTLIKIANINSSKDISSDYTEDEVKKIFTLIKRISNLNIIY